MEQKIKDFFKFLGIEYCKITNIPTGSVLVCLFPYFTNGENGNLSKYARGEDYHIVCKRYLSMAVEHFGFDAEIYADISPYNDIELAFNAGLGIIGKNGLLINEKYGSYVFIGYIVMKDVFFNPDESLKGSCLNCGLCAKHCPGGALSSSGLNKNLCLSHLTQKKGVLTSLEETFIKKGSLIWGCDICSDVCPLNKNAIPTPIKEFYENPITSLSLEDINNLSLNEFKKKYHSRAFTWRGKQPLVRNLHLKK